MCILLVNDSGHSCHYGEYAVRFDEILLEDGSFDPEIAKGINHIVFTRKEVKDMKAELKELHELLEKLGVTSPYLHILTDAGSRRPAQTLRDYLSE